MVFLRSAWYSFATADVGGFLLKVMLIPCGKKQEEHAVLDQSTFTKEEAEAKIGEQILVRLPSNLSNEIVKGEIVGISQEDTEYVLMVKWTSPEQEEAFSKEEYLEYLARWVKR
jgi:hypothetical protein